MPLAVKAPFNGSAVVKGAIMALTAVTAAANVVVLTAANAVPQAAGAWLLTGVQRSANDWPAGRPAAVETIRSVSGVILTVWPAAVAIEVSVTCLPPEVPMMLRKYGAVRPLTSTVNAPDALLETGGDDLPLISMATTVPEIGAPVAAVPLMVVATTGGLVTGGFVTGATGELPPPQAVRKTLKPSIASFRMEFPC